MNNMMEDGLLHAAGNSILSSVAPAVVLVPMLNPGRAPDILQLAAILADGAAPPDSSRARHAHSPDSSVTLRTSPRIVVLSVVEVPPDEPLTTGLEMARSYRALLDFLPSEVESGNKRVRVDRLVKVARDVGSAIHEAAYEEHATLILLHWKGYAREAKRRLYGRIMDSVLKNPPCTVVLARLEGWTKSRRVFLPVRGGPAAEQALTVGVVLAERLGLPMAVLHNVPMSDPSSGGAASPGSLTTGELLGLGGIVSQVEALGEEPYIVFNEHLRKVRETASIPVEIILTRQPDPVEALLDEARGDDLLIMGLPALDNGGQDLPAAEGSVAMRVSDVKGPPMLLFNTPAALDLAGYALKVKASRSKKRLADMPFEHWFVEHTYHGDEFKDPDEFLAAKRASGLTLSVAVLTSNDSKHIRSVLMGLKRVLMEMHPITDQIVVVDAGSYDNTIEVARDLGVEAYRAEDIMPAQGNLHGRGEAWWKSLGVIRGDILVWLDPMAKRFHPSTVLSLAGPLLRNSALQLVKAFGQDETAAGTLHTHHRREDDFSPVDMSWGGFVVPRRTTGSLTQKVRVQALKPSDIALLSPGQIAMLPPRTLLQVLSPALAGVIAPFSRDMAARREAMLDVPVFAGDNLDLGLLLSVAAQFGTNAISQVELRQHQPAPPPAPGIRTSIDVLQVLAIRLQDAAMRRYASQIVAHLEIELEGKRGHIQPEGMSSIFEVRALGPVERPPARRVLGE